MVEGFGLDVVLVSRGCATGFALVRDGPNWISVRVTTSLRSVAGR